MALRDNRDRFPIALAIVPKEAEIVRSIFDGYLAGEGVTSITKGLNESGYVTRDGCVFYKSVVERILRNYDYTGNLLLQTKFRENHLTKVTRKNYPGITRRTPTKLSFRWKFSMPFRRRTSGEKKNMPRQATTNIPLHGLHHLRHLRQALPPQNHRHGLVWFCSTYNSCCPSKIIPEEN